MNYYSIERSTDHLAHYGVKGMKWGVRRALAQGNEKALDRHFRKAAKKLRKLQDIGLNSKKYAAKSAAYGAAAAGAGTLAIGGTGLADKMIGKARGGIYNKLYKKYTANIPKGNAYAKKMASDMARGKAKAFEQHIKDLGNKNIITKTVTTNVTDASGNPVLIKGTNIQAVRKEYGVPVLKGRDLYRIGTGALAAGLAAKSAQNAYRASHGAKYRQKAINFKNQMDESFRGTKYEGQYIVPPKKKKKRR